MKGPLLIRADASADIGTGHVMRCLALAQAWSAAGGHAIFLHASSTPALEQRVHSAGMKTLGLDAERGSTEDAAQTIIQARACDASWVVADGYCFGEPWQKQIKEAGLRLLVLDDYGHAACYHADLVLNQNSFASPLGYEERDAATRLLLGARYALLRPEFLTWREWRREIPEVARKLLVTMGGGDPDNVTAKVIAAAARLPDAEVVVCVGGSNPNLDALKAAVAAGTANIRLVINATNMPEIMGWADVAFAAGGSTSWELAYLGLPAVVTVLADNQAPIAADLERRGVSQNLGDHRVLTVEEIFSALQSLMANGDQRRAMSDQGRRLVDGRGASRVAAALGAKLKLTFVSDADSWLNPALAELKKEFEAAGHHVRCTHEPAAIEEGDIAFLLSLGRMVPPNVLRRNAHNLVVHESALPHGRGWSPLTWQILEGKTEIPVSLIEAGESVDSGDIYGQRTIRFRGDELVAELRSAQAVATLELCRDFIVQYPFSTDGARAQIGEPTHYPRRRPADSRLDPDKTLREQFNLLRVADPERYPAFFELAGRRFEVRLSVT